jgi:hypothetical protein
MPPNDSADVALDASTPPLLLLDEPLLPHPAAASMRLPMAAAMATPVFFFRTFPSDLHDHGGQDASIVARECDRKMSINQMNDGWLMNGS